MQEDLPLPFQRQIISDFCHLTEVHSVLAVVDIVIGFIVSAGGSSDTLIHEYIHETLKMPPESGLVSIRAKQQCRLKHVVSLWRLLTLEKGRHLSLANQVSMFIDARDAHTHRRMHTIPVGWGEVDSDEVDSDEPLAPLSLVRSVATGSVSVCQRI